MEEHVRAALMAVADRVDNILAQDRASRWSSDQERREEIAKAVHAVDSLKSALKSL